MKGNEHWNLKYSRPPIVFHSATKTVKRRLSLESGAISKKQQKEKIDFCTGNFIITYNISRRNFLPYSEFSCLPIVDEQVEIAKEATSEPDASVQLLEDSVLAL